MYFLNVECGRLCCLVSFAPDPGTSNLALQPGSVASNLVNGPMITPGVIRALPSPLGSAQAEYQGNLPSSDGQNPAGTYQTKRHRQRRQRHLFFSSRGYEWLLLFMYFSKPCQREDSGAWKEERCMSDALETQRSTKNGRRKISCHLVIF